MFCFPENAKISKTIEIDALSKLLYGKKMKYIKNYILKVEMQYLIDSDTIKLKKGNEIDYSVTSTTSATIMLKSSKEKDAAWKFIKWWLGEEAQIGYARNMEAILGAAGRYQTANLKAFDLLPGLLKIK